MDTVERWQRIEALFHETSTLPAHEQAGFLEKQAGGDETLISEVLELLESDGRVSGLLSDASFSANASGVAWSKDPWIGRTIGVFRITELLGRGGMGRVYRGERIADGMSQTVAIKLIAELLPSPSARQRFLEERDALARLQHRNVARLIDGGTTAEALPYLAMEFVQGRRLDEACEEPGVTLHRVIGYMQQLCDAMGYVHRNMLLHCDLKPGNVLIAGDEEVKLLDFGTFSFLDPAVSGVAGQDHIRALTLRYASPEQILGEAMSTASDTFALGMVLYRVLLGRLPEEFDGLDADAYLNAIRTQKLTPVAVEIVKKWSIRRSLADDLQCILVKALTYAVDARYQDTGALAADLRAALESKPLAAARSTGRDGVRRFLRRNRRAIGLSAAAFLLLIGGIAITLSRERIAIAERHRAEAGVLTENHLTHFLLVDYFEQLKQIPGSTDAQKHAVSRALTYADQIAALADKPELQLDRVQAYTEMGSLLGNPYESNLDDTAGAIRTLLKAVTLAAQLRAAHPNDPAYRQAEAAADLALGRTYFGSGNPREAVKYLSRAAEDSERIAASAGVDAPTVAQAASAVDALGDVYGLEGANSLDDPASAVRYYRRAQELDAKGLSLDPGCARCRRGVAVEDWKIGMKTDDPAQAAASFSAGMSTLAAFPASDQATARVQRLLTVLRQRLGSSELKLGHTDEGLRISSEVRHQFQQAVRLDPVDARALFDLFALDYDVTEWAVSNHKKHVALDFGRETWTTANTLVYTDPGNEEWKLHRAEAAVAYGQALSAAGEAAGEAQQRQGVAQLVRFAQKPGASESVLNETARALLDSGQDDRMALQFAEDAVQHATGPTADEYLLLAEAQARTGKAGDARQTAQRAINALHSQPHSTNRTEQIAAATAILKTGVERNAAPPR